MINAPQFLCVKQAITFGRFLMISSKILLSQEENSTHWKSGSPYKFTNPRAISRQILASSVGIVNDSSVNTLTRALLIILVTFDPDTITLVVSKNTKFHVTLETSQVAVRVRIVRENTRRFQSRVRRYIASIYG